MARVLERVLGRSKAEADWSLGGLTRLRRLFLGERKNRTTRPMRQLVGGVELGVLVQREVEQGKVEFLRRPQQVGGAS
jgi:hypothetical protein